MFFVGFSLFICCILSVLVYKWPLTNNKMLWIRGSGKGALKIREPNGRFRTHLCVHFFIYFNIILLRMNKTSVLLRCCVCVKVVHYRNNKWLLFLLSRRLLHRQMFHLKFVATTQMFWVPLLQFNLFLRQFLCVVLNPGNWFDRYFYVHVIKIMKSHKMTQ